MSGHTVIIEFEAKWGVSSRLECGYDSADESRPCWPHTENGEPYDTKDGIRAGCVYNDWWGEYELDSLGGPTRIVRFNLDGAEWDGDSFTFVLGHQLPAEDGPS